MSVETVDLQAQGTVLDRNVLVDNPKVELVKPGTRDEFLAEWKHDPTEVFDRAKAAGLALDSYSRVRAPASEHSRGESTMEWLLYNLGVRMVDTVYAESTPMIHFDLAPDDGPKDPLVRAMNAYWDECYYRTLWTGKRNASAISTLTSGGPWRPIYD